MMAWIRVIERDEAQGALKIEYERSIRRAGKIFNIVKLQSLNPATLRAGVQLYAAAVLGASELSREDRELLGTVVSRVNGCFY
jgi:alkylhydroperoxidase family enzyme